MKISKSLSAISLSICFVSCGSGPSKMGARAVVDRYIESGDAHGKTETASTKKEKKTNEGELSLEEIRNSNIAFGIRSFDQIRESMAVLTTVDPLSTNSDGETIAEKFKDLSSQLPESNDAKAFLASHQVAISKLAVEYCDALVDDATKRQSIFPSIDFSQPANTALSQDKHGAFAMELINQFWGKDLNNRPDDTELQQEISQLIQDISAGENGNNTQSTLNISKGTCAAVLASAPSMFL